MNTNPQALHVLDAFRQEAYQALLKRRDALFELVEAMLTASDVSSLVRLTLSPLFQRQWPSAPDALEAGRLDENALRRLIGAQVPLPPPNPSPSERPVWALDGTVWPRPKAETSPERTYGHWTSQGIPQEGVIPAWEYQWLGIVPPSSGPAGTSGSWYLPLDVLRRAPGAGTPTSLALVQIRRSLLVLPKGYPRPIVTFDSNYDVTELGLAIQVGPREQRLAVDALVRLSPRRRLYRRADAYSGKGRRPIHGRPFRLPEIADRPVETLSPEDLPDRAIAFKDPSHGVVTICEWRDLHPFGGKGLDCLSLSVIRVSVERLSKSAKRPKPLWLCWISPEPLPDLTLAWAWYRRRFVCEHGFRFFKQTLGWTKVRPRWPRAADRWTWLIVLVVWQLWLAKDVVADQRLPWEREVAVGQLSPGRVRRAIGPILAALSHPQAPPQRRGNAPGRALGCCPGRRTRYKVVKSPKKAAKSAA
jgi:hypothetical protein